MTARRQRAIELAAYDGDPPPVAQPVWEAGLRNLAGEQVCEQRLWFNTVLRGRSDTRMHQNSTYLTEDEAIRWGKAGLVRVQDVLSGTRIQSRAAFDARHPPNIDRSLILDIHASMPTQWVEALRDGTAMASDEQCLPARPPCRASR